MLGQEGMVLRGLKSFNGTPFLLTLVRVRLLTTVPLLLVEKITLVRSPTIKVIEEKESGVIDVRSSKVERIGEL